MTHFFYKTIIAYREAVCEALVGLGVSESEAMEIIAISLLIDYGFAARINPDVIAGNMLGICSCGME